MDLSLMGEVLGLHEKALNVSENYRRAESQLIEILSRLDKLSGYLQFGHRSLFDYAVSELKLSPSVSYSLIQVVKKSQSVPELKDAVADQSLTLSHARRIAPVLTPENKEVWIEKAKNLSVRELDRELAASFPKEMAREQVKYTHSDRADLTLNISDDVLKKLKRVQDLLSQKKSRAVKLEETLDAIAEEFIERHDPVEKAKRISKKSAPSAKEKNDGSDEIAHAKSATSKTPTKKIPLPGENTNSIPSAIKHQVVLRDQGQCTFVHSNGKRCPSRRWIDIHHIKPREEGGTHALSNLITLCRAHHQHQHLVCPHPTHL